MFYPTSIIVPMTSSLEITAVVLAGGQGRRMEGADKGLLQFRDRPLIEHALAALRPQVSDILISANRNLPKYERYGYTVVPDAGSQACGPLAGLLAALQWARTEYVLTVPCDAPYLSGDYADRMIAALAKAGALAAVAYDGMRLQPMFSLISRRLTESLQDYLAAGERRARDFLVGQGAVPVDFSDRTELFVNLNRPVDLHRQIARAMP